MEMSGENLKIVLKIWNQGPLLMNAKYCSTMGMEKLYWI